MTTDKHSLVQFASVLLFVLLPVLPCQAGKVLAARAEHRDGHYLLHLDMQIHAHYDDVIHALLDFKDIPLINDSIKSARLLTHKDTVYRVQLIGEGCLWIFCRHIQQVTTVTARGDGYISADTDPAHSDLSYGRELWHVMKEGKTTRVQYNADVVPAFWIPPLIGPTLFEHRLLEEGQKTINGIEHLIQSRQPHS